MRFLEVREIFVKQIGFSKHYFFIKDYFFHTSVDITIRKTRTSCFNVFVSLFTVVV